VQAKTLAQIRFEEDRKPRADSPNYERTNRKYHNEKSGNNRNAPYHRSEKYNVNAVHDRRDLPPPLSDFNLTVNTVELVKRLDNMGSAVNGREEMTGWT